MCLAGLVWCGLALGGWPGTARAADEDEEKTRDMQSQLKEELNRERAALQQLSEETLDLDRQVEAIKELVMMKNDLERLKQEHRGLSVDEETARARFEAVTATIIQSADQVQAARTNQDIERAMQMAKEKVEEIKRQMTLAERDYQDMEKAQAALAQDLAALTAQLQQIKNTYRRQLGVDEKIAQQLDKLLIEVGALQAKLKTLTSVAQIKEVAKAIDAVREKIEILQSKLRLLGRHDVPTRQVLRQVVKLDEVIDAETVEDPALQNSVEKLWFLRMLKLFREKLLRLFYNTLKYFWTDEIGGTMFALRAVLTLLAAALITTALIWRRR
jgi:DNA repair exonuclease SbcCD ATPase subunit